MGYLSKIKVLLILEGDIFYENEAKNHSVERQSFTSTVDNMCADVYICLAPS